MSIEESILKQSDDVQAGKNRKHRKEKGVFYTPPEVIDRMTEKLLSGIDLAANPYIRVLDPACGTGLFLAKAFEILKNEFEMNINEIMDRNKGLEGKLTKDGIGCFIVENILWGVDIDSEALSTARDILIKLAGKKCRTNLTLGDSLLYQEDGLYEYVLGNPPYIGHKQVSGEYKKTLQQIYRGIYRDKSDISYCFLKKGMDLLKDGGTLSFITSRYFLEGPSAEGLRKYISGSCTITEIIDFYGRSIFKEAGVAACIITLKKGNWGDKTSVLKQKQRISAPAAGLFEESNFEHFTVKKAELKDEGWVLLNPERFRIFSAMEEKGGLELADIVDSYQGIITGCDKAFVLKRNEIEENKIEEALIRPWIKNSDILKDGINAAKLFIIYSDLIEDEKAFPNAIKYIARYRERLQERRECKRGVRKWFQLQWGRNSSIFDTPKIVYPYKSANSRFVVDKTGKYCSADIYSLKLKKKYEGTVTLDYIAAVLSSRLFEFYFKCYGKKISENLYDYYPNTVLRMKIPNIFEGSLIQQLAEELVNCKNEDCEKAVTYEIDRELYKLYGLTEEQIEIVERT